MADNKRIQAKDVENADNRGLERIAISGKFGSGDQDKCLVTAEAVLPWYNDAAKYPKQLAIVGQHSMESVNGWLKGLNCGVDVSEILVHNFNNQRLVGAYDTEDGPKSGVYNYYLTAISDVSKSGKLSKLVSNHVDKKIDFVGAKKVFPRIDLDYRIKNLEVFKITGIIQEAVTPLNLITLLNGAGFDTGKLVDFEAIMKNKDVFANEVHIMVKVSEQNPANVLIDYALVKESIQVMESGDKSDPTRKERRNVIRLTTDDKRCLTESMFGVHQAHITRFSCAYIDLKKADSMIPHVIGRTTRAQLMKFLCSKCGVTGEHFTRYCPLKNKLSAQMATRELGRKNKADYVQSLSANLAKKWKQ